MTTTQSMRYGRLDPLLAACMALGASALLFLSSLPGGAQGLDNPPAATPAFQRYVMQPMEDGFVRLDTVTGTMSLCRQSDEGGLICRMAADERQALEEELARLNERIEMLEKRTPLAQDPPMADDDGGPPRDRPRPSEEEIERSLSLMEKAMRRFFAIIEDLNRDFDDRDRPANGAERPENGNGVNPDPDAQPGRT